MLHSVFREAVAVGLGAASGAVARHLLLLAGLDGHIGILVINALGCLALGYFRPGVFWGTGVLGGFTTFATFSLLTASGTWQAAAAYVLVTAVACVGAVLLGYRFSDRAGRNA
ncbi:MAG: fluoride efflux transporter family protein [Corynebacterium sp.]|nr:fluoride efflux transporter family protein [Corynebacterium sp.]